MSSTVSRNNVVIDQISGSVDLTATDFNVFTTTALGNWAGRTSQVTVDLPTGNQPRSSNGIEVTSFDIMDLGLLVPHSTYIFDIAYSFDTSSTIGSPSGSFALSDFSGTGSVKFRAVDGTGNEITDYTVSPVLDTVPEPTTIAALVLGLGFFMRRRTQN